MSKQPRFQPDPDAGCDDPFAPYRRWVTEHDTWTEERAGQCRDQLDALTTRPLISVILPSITRLLIS